MNYLLNNIQGWVHNGCAGNDLMGISDTDVAVGASAGITTASAIVQFNKAAVAPATITMGAAAKGSINVSFPEWSKVAVGSVTNNGAGAEGADTAVTDLTSVANTVEVLRNSITAQLPDLVVHGSSDAILVQAGQVLGNAVAAEFDANVCALFDAFATSKGASTEGLRWLDVMDAVASLETNDAPRPYSAVLHPQQMYGSFGLSNELGQIAAVNGSNGAFAGGSSASEQFMSAGFVTSLAGINFYTSPQVIDGSDGTEKKGAIFAKTALGAGFLDRGAGSFLDIETDRNALAASTVLACNGYWAVTELVDLHGVEIFTEIS